MLRASPSCKSNKIVSTVGINQLTARDETIYRGKDAQLEVEADDKHVPADPKQCPHTILKHITK